MFDQFRREFESPDDRSHLLKLHIENFIIGHLAWESKAGRFGTFVLFLGLGVGFLGFLAKYLIQWWLER